VNKFLLVLFAFLLVLPAGAQAIHFHDIALARGNGINANIVPYASVYACVTGTNCATQVTVYQDAALTIPLTQPITGDGNGNWAFYSNGIPCVDLKISAGNQGIQTIYNYCAPYVATGTGIASVSIASGHGVSGTSSGGTNPALTLNVTGAITPTSVAINGGTPITGASSANPQVVTCPTGGSGTQVCDASGSWISSGTGSAAFPSTAGIVCNTSVSASVNCPLQQTYTATFSALDPTGGTDDSSLINGYVTTVNSSLILPPGTYYTPSYSNVNGVPINGDGTLLRAVNQQAFSTGTTLVTATREQINGYSDKSRFIAGMEYLSEWWAALEADASGTLTPQEIVFSGDSTTSGVGVTSPFLVDEMATGVFQARGVIGVTTVNQGHSGQCSSQWLSSYLAQDLALNPNVYVIRWGINDPAVGCALSPAQTIANMRSGLATIRASFSVDQMTVILEMPSATNDNPNGRNRAFHEALRNGFMQAARDYQAVFIDTYGEMPDADSTTVCMTHDYQTSPGPSTPIIQIHPTNCKNPSYNSLLMDVLLPSGQAQMAMNQFWNIPSSQFLPSSTVLPSSYPFGMADFRATLSAWPFDGTGLDFRSTDNVSIQFNAPYNAGVSDLAFRISQGVGGTSWNPWAYVATGNTPGSVNATAASTFLAGSSPVGIEATSSSGASVINFLDPSGNAQAIAGYGNSSASLFPGAGYFDVGSSLPFIIGVGGVAKLTANSSGVTIPQLTVSGTGSGALTLSSNSSSIQNAGGYVTIQGDGTSGTGLDFRVVNSSNTIQNFVVEDNGSVGWGSGGSIIPSSTNVCQSSGTNCPSSLAAHSSGTITAATYPASSCTSVFSTSYTTGSTAFSGGQVTFTEAPTAGWSSGALTTLVINNGTEFTVYVCNASTSSVTAAAITETFSYNL
jgi:hypothetical protein